MFIQFYSVQNFILLDIKNLYHMNLNYKINNEVTTTTTTTTIPR